MKRPFPVAPFEVGDVDARAYRRLREAALEFGFLPSFSHGIVLEVAMMDPSDEAAVAAIRRLTHQEVHRFGIGEEDFDRALALLETAWEAAEPATAGKDEVLVRPDAWDFFRKSPREIAAELVRFAYAVGASDLLLDEQEEWMDVAVKTAGRKEILPPVDRANGALLLKAFKEIAGLSTQTVTNWQTGAASFPVENGRRADLRIEITPSVHGESLVARIQDRQLQLERMRELPFRSAGQRRIAEGCLRQAQGLIIATGPTGHGKTTTLYSCLGQLDRSVLNLRTLEDPVEFAIPWITQIPVGAGTGRSFGEGLKSLLRQAPHAILMGEIRDGEVAQTCIEAVDTGHLIFATLHTRDAIGVVPRLLDLGLSGRQIASSLLLAIGQRLLRKLCPQCRQPAPLTAAQRRHFEGYHLAVPEALHVPGGCPSCGEQGERGVVPVFEFLHLPSSDEIADQIARAEKASFQEHALRARWLQLGGSSLVREALLLAAAGEVAYAEVLKFERNPPTEEA